MNEMDQILMREHHLENETLSLKAKGLTPVWRWRLPPVGRSCEGGYK